MPQCKWCRSSNLSLMLDPYSGLCENCLPTVGAEIIRRVRIIRESVALVNQSRNLDTQIRRLDVILEHAIGLLKYEECGIPTPCDPLPSQLTGGQIAKWRDAAIVAGMQEELQQTLIRGANSRNVRSQKNRLSKLFARIQYYKGEASNGSLLDEFEAQVRQRILQSQGTVQQLAKAPISIRFGCEICGQHLEAEEDLVGQIATCVNCGNKITVPRESTLPP